MRPGGRRALTASLPCGVAAGSEHSGSGGRVLCSEMPRAGHAWRFRLPGQRVRLCVTRCDGWLSRALRAAGNGAAAEGGLSRGACRSPRQAAAGGVSAARPLGAARPLLRAGEGAHRKQRQLGHVPAHVPRSRHPWKHGWLGPPGSDEGPRGRGLGAGPRGRGRVCLPPPPQHLHPSTHTGPLGSLTLADTRQARGGPQTCNVSPQTRQLPSPMRLHCLCKGGVCPLLLPGGRSQVASSRSAHSKPILTLPLP